MNDFDPLDIMFAPPGTKVKFLNANGYSHQPADAVATGLVPGEFYTIRGVVIPSSSSLVYLTEFPSKGFNTVMFDCCHYDEEYDEWYDTYREQYGF